MTGVATLPSLSFTSDPFLRRRFSASLLTAPAKNVEKASPITMTLRRWELPERKPNGLPILPKMHVKIGDTIKVIAGRDKGKIGEISRIIKYNSTVIVKDVNMKTKHMKSQQKDEPGKIVKIEAPIHSSNVMLYSKEKEVASRVGHKFLEDGTRVRYLIKTGEIIDFPEEWKRKE